MTKHYIKTIEGVVHHAYTGKGSAFINGVKVYNPTEQMLIDDGWTEYVAPARTLSQAQEEKASEIDNYDSSEAVNQFYLGNAAMWLDKTTRTGLLLRFEAEEAAGRTTTTLWYGNVCYILPIESAKQMLVAIEVYASDCYDNTAQHKANVMNLDTIEEVDNYDYTTGYPEKLSFEYSE